MSNVTHLPKTGREANLLEQAMLPQEDADVVQKSLDFVRRHLDMEVGYLSEVVGDKIVFRVVSAPGFEDLISVGGQVPLDQIYCPHVLSGDLPEMIPDTSLEPFAMTIPLTTQLPIGSHVTIPIMKRDGTTYGAFCCLSRGARPSLNARDMDVMRAFATLAAETVNEVLTERAERSDIEARIRETIDQEQFNIVYQPILDCKTHKPKGFEALSRFSAEPYRTPDVWFAEADSVGMQAELEIAAIRAALGALDKLPADVYVSVNASPNTVEAGHLLDAFAGYNTERIVLEITEHATVNSYETLMTQIDMLRYKGVRIAIDDAGAGFSGLKHIVRLRPEIIKLDISLTAKIDEDIVRRSLANALVSFAKETHALIIAEGVETTAEFDTLSELGVELVQGYLLGKPAPIETGLAWFENEGSTTEDTA